MKHLLFSLSFLTIVTAKAQQNNQSRNGFKIPSDITESVKLLDAGFNKKTKEEFKLLKEEDLRKVNGIFFLNEWSENDSTAFVKYFNKIKITNHKQNDRDYLTLLAYHRSLNKKPFDITREANIITRKNDSLSLIRSKRFNSLLSADSIKGVYIPADIPSCMKILDQLLSSEIKNDIRKCAPNDVVASYHMTTGLWMRNNWGLYDGSRLYKLLYDRGIDQPDGMSGFILKSYQHYLSSQTPDYDKVLKDFLPEFKKMKELRAANESQFAQPLYDPEVYKVFLKSRKISEFTVKKY